MNKTIEMVGKRYGRLIAIKYLGVFDSRTYLLCKCDCGSVKKVRSDHLRTEKILSCGCYRTQSTIERSVKHNQSYNPLYSVWSHMMDRCYNERFQHYGNYGGRGISVDKRWHNVSNFIEDVSAVYRKGLQIDRIENSGNYSKYNYRWVTRKINNRNKRNNVLITVGTVTHTAVEWHEITGVRYTTILSRVNRGKIGADIFKIKR